MEKKKRGWEIVIAVTACLLATILILGTCGSGTIQEGHWADKFVEGRREDELVDSTDYAVRAGLQMEAASVVLATPWGVLLRFSAPEGYYMTSYKVNDGEPVGVKQFDTTDHFVFLTPGEKIGFSVCYQYVAGIYELYVYSFAAD